MKRVLLASVGLFFFAVSCRKGFEPIGPQNPLNSTTYQVAEYHRPVFDQHFGYYALFPFKKKYDPSGRTVVEIDGSYDFPIGTYDYLNIGYREMKVEQKGHMLYLLDKNLPAGKDTLLRVTLNAKGRPASSISEPGWTPVSPLGGNHLEQTYLYKDDRIIAVRNKSFDPPYIDPVDSLVYDKYGDLLSFNQNTYVYDYTHPAKQQFYCEGWQNFQESFYYLQYLGYFPEVTSPSYIMIKYTNLEGASTIANHKFDHLGRLISFDNGPLGPTNGPTTITWK